MHPSDNKIRMTKTYIRGEAQNNMDRQTDKVSYRADFQIV